MDKVLLIAHGAPANPDPQDLTMQQLAAAVAAHLPDMQVLGATLAKEGSLKSAVDQLEYPLIYPFFMAEGWFTKRELPRRLSEIGADHLRQLPPLGVDPDLPDLMARAARAGAEAAGLTPEESHLLLAAHGSKIARKSKDSSYDMADKLRQISGFKDISVGLIEESPFLSDQAEGLTKAICLPFFALRAGHVVGDIPEALTEAGFTGPCLPPIGEHPEIPALIAAAIKRGIVGNGS